MAPSFRSGERRLSPACTSPSPYPTEAAGASTRRGKVRRGKQERARDKRRGDEVGCESLSRVGRGPLGTEPQAGQQGLQRALVGVGASGQRAWLN